MILRLLALLLATAFFGIVAQDSSVSFILTRTSIETNVRYTTHTTRTTAALTPLPSHSFTKNFTRRETTIITVPSTVSVTGIAILYTPTVVTYVYITPYSSLVTQTSVIFIYDTSIIGALTTTDTVCRNGPSPSVIPTVYTGTYTPSVSSPIETSTSLP